MIVLYIFEVKNVDVHLTVYSDPILTLDSNPSRITKKMSIYVPVYDFFQK